MYTASSLEDIAAAFDRRAVSAAKRADLTTGRQRADINAEVKVWNEAAAWLRKTTIVQPDEAERAKERMG